jgi:hypothetical protein
MVNLSDPMKLKPEEINKLLTHCRKTNMVFYQYDSGLNDDRSIPLNLGKIMGLEHLDGNLCADDDSLSAIQVMQGGSRHEGYIPYTNRAINWHTDGYYNVANEYIQAMLLHCVSDAVEGGENEFLDHEIVYILLRDENPEYISALMQPDAMTIPPNIENGVKIRGSRTGPVFSVNAKGNLHMRYTARTRSIEWKDDPLTTEAVKFIQDLFSGGSDYIFKYRLGPGQGVISNNVLHNRTAFIDNEQAGHKRLIYRGRYYDRIQGTGYRELMLQEQSHAMA